MSDSAWETFAACVDAGDDAATEAAVAALSAQHEAALLHWCQAGSPPDRRWWAVRALAAVGGDAAPAVVAQAFAAPDPSLRAAAALALGHLAARAPRAVEEKLPALARLLEDDDGFVRQAAVDGFALAGDLSLPTLAVLLLQDGHEAARTRAASALRRVRSLKAAPLLFRCLNDHNHLVHSYCHEALDEMGLLDNLLLLP